MPPSIQQLTYIYDLQHKRNVINRQEITHGNYTNVNDAMSRLYRKFTDAQISLSDNDVYQKLRYLRFRIRHYPLPFSYHDELCNEIMQLIDIYWNAYPYAQNEMDIIKNQILPIIMNSEDNPIFQTLCDLKPEPIHIILYRNNHLIRDVEALFRENCVDQRMKILSETQYLDVETYEHVVVVGSPGLFRDAIFQSMRAQKLTVIYTVGSSAQIRDTNILDEFSPLPNTPNRQKDTFFDSKTISNDDTSPPTKIDWLRIKQQVEDDSREDTSTKTVSANILQFEDGYYTFVESAPNEGIQALDVSRLSNNRGDGLYVLKRRDMRPGLYVLLRTDDDTDYVETMANRILKDSAEGLRATLHEWKNRFDTCIREVGIDEVINILLDSGATDTAKNPMNVLRWADLSNIKPQNSRDFRAVLIVAGYTNAEIDTVMRDAKLISDAHIQAGQEVRRQLRNHISTQRISIKNISSRIDFELPDIGAKLSAFEIEEVSTEKISVARWRVHKLFITTQ